MASILARGVMAAASSAAPAASYIGLSPLNFPFQIAN
jgi:hypothetical protein